MYAVSECCFGDARRQMHVAHLPAGRDAAAVVDGDHVVAPRVGAARSRARADHAA